MEAAAKTNSDEREALLTLFPALVRPLMPVALEQPDDSPTSRHYGVGVFFFEESPKPVSCGDAQSRAVDSSVNRLNGSIREVHVLAPPVSIKSDQGNSGKSK
jgi:hypothetical protein